jgi:hypothetical protein
MGALGGHIAAASSAGNCRPHPPLYRRTTEKRANQARGLSPIGRSLSVELEAKFNRLKHPVNPTAARWMIRSTRRRRPPQTGRLDPTLILVDPDATGGSGSDAYGGITKLDIAPIDHGPDWQPDPVTTPPAGGESAGGGTVGRRWP